jgi:hypothetical protein
MGCIMNISKKKIVWTLFIYELKIVGNKPSCIGFCLHMGEKFITHRLSCVLNFLILDF